MSVQAWLLMGRQLDWNALPVVVEKLGIDDVEAVIDDCVLMRYRSEED